MGSLLGGGDLGVFSYVRRVPWGQEVLHLEGGWIVCQEGALGEWL